MDETNYFGPVKIEPTNQPNYYTDDFDDNQHQQPSYPSNETELKPQVTESARSNNYCSLTPTPNMLTSSPTPTPTRKSTNPSKSDKKNQKNHHQHPLLNGKVAVLKLERIDPSKYIPSPTPSNRPNKRGRYNFRTTKKPTKRLKSDDISANSTDSESTLSPKLKRRPRGSVESFPLIEKLKIPKFHGNFPCQFCPISKEYASELAVHEALHHSSTTPYKSSPKPGQSPKLRQSHNCPRCPYTASRRHYYIYHHLKEHLGFKDSKLLNVHNIISSPSKELQPCEICQIPIPTQSQTKLAHFKTYHDLSQLKPGENPQNCSLCPAYFLRGLHLLKHQQIVHNSAVITQKNKKSYPCNNCPHKFCSLRKLWNHRRNDCEMRHTFNWVATCEMDGCGPNEKFESTAELDYHVTHYHNGHKFNGEPRICPNCGRVCIGEIGLRRHMEIHKDDEEEGNSDDERKWKCEICPGKIFETRVLWKMHMKYHNRKLKKSSGHMCDQCGKTFRIKSLLDQHYEFHKDKNNWKWSCEICKKKCSTKQSLQVHQRSHSGEKPYECEICQEKFAYRHVLRWHVTRKHKEEDKPRKYTKNSMGPGGGHQARPKDPGNLNFWCEICKRCLASKQALKTHERTHTGEMPYKCQVCKERFRYRHILRMHVNKEHEKDGVVDIPRNYQKEKVKAEEDVKVLVEFKCEICEKCLASKQALQTHMRVHTGDKPFCCEVCGEKFRHRHILRSHVNREHGEDGIQDLPRPYIKQSEPVG